MLSSARASLMVSSFEFIVEFNNGVYVISFANNFFCTGQH